MINVAIDGPSGAGKSSLSKIVAKKLGYIYIDTGAIYRTVGLFAFKNNVDPTDEVSVCSLLDKINIEVCFVEDEQHIILNGEDVSKDIRIHIISEYASKVSAHKGVREFLLGMQRKLASENNAIMDGRDIGTVVLPDADVKIFLTASAEARAKRRHLELLEKGQEIPFETVLNDIIERDERDSTRDIAPLKPAEDSILVDTTEYNFEQSIDLILNAIKDNI